MRKIITKRFLDSFGGYTEIDKSFVNKGTPELNNFIKNTFLRIYIQNKNSNINNKLALNWFNKLDIYNNNRNNRRVDKNNIVMIIEDQLNIIGYFIIDPGFLFMYDFLLEEESTGSRFHSLASAIYTPTKSSIDRLDINMDDKILLLSTYCNLLLYYFNPNILESEYKIKFINSVYKELEMLLGNLRHIIFYLDQNRPEKKKKFIDESINNFLNKSKPYFQNSILNRNNKNLIKLFKKMNLVSL